MKTLIKHIIDNGLVAVVSLSFGGNLCAQNIAKDYYRRPLEVPIQLAADFGELRPNHFHMGFDIRTQQRENLPVIAVADGYISRVFISPFGYGNMLMITHPNGTRSLYGHMNAFYPELQKAVIEKQYSDQSWSQDYDLPAGKFPVKKGQQIGLSGNTGGSMGPHVHFEIRNLKTGNNYNPMLVTNFVPDHIKPYIYHFYYYDGNQSTYAQNAVAVGISGSNGNYKTMSSVIKVGSDKIGLGFNAEDKTDNSPFKFGIYSAEVNIENEPYYGFKLTDFDADATRYVNASIDYKRKMNGSNYIQYIFRLPGNKMQIFSGKNDGFLHLEPNKVYPLTIDIADAAGNVSHLTTAFEYIPSLAKSYQHIRSQYIAIPNQSKSIHTDAYDFAYSNRAFYDTVYYGIEKVAPSMSTQVSSTYKLIGADIPIHDEYTVGLEANLGKTFRKDRVVMNLNSGSGTDVKKGSWIGNRMVSSFKRLGYVRLIEDLTAPTVAPINLQDGSSFSEGNIIRLRIKDNLADMGPVNAYIDNKWIIMGQLHDNVYFYKVDSHFPLGKHTLKIVAEDIAGNQTIKEYNIFKK